jgi:hypothetical protein
MLIIEAKGYPTRAYALKSLWQIEKPFTSEAAFIVKLRPCRCKSNGRKFLYLKGYLFRTIHKVKNAVFLRIMSFGFVFLTFYCGYIKTDLIKLLFTGFHFFSKYVYINI